ncbi:MAG TPA: DUF1501 domain-containing protein [Planctomycetaceae bacterium]|nr:DUF1501 domain-containing protein [Planctomycetaceae bacterium]
MLHRRDAMIRLGRIGLGAVTLPQLLRAEAVIADQPGAARRSPIISPSGRRGKAKSCILVYLWGGPPQQDMWDMKPAAAEGIRSQFKSISTVVPGIDVCEHLPLFARHTDKLALVRSVTHESNNHEPSVYRTLTGRINNTLAIPRNKRNRNDFPTLGSVVSYTTPMGPMPAAVTIPRPIGHDGVTYSGTHAGFLGGRHDPMEVEAAEETDEKPTHSIALPAEIQETRLLARRGLLNVIEDSNRRMQSERVGMSLDGYRELAFSMLSSPVAKRAFNLELEDPATRERYGRNEYGESMLLARRLVEAGVRLVTISWMYIQKSGNVANVWDNHGPFEGLTGTEMLKAYYCLPSLDRGFCALMDDLSASGLIDETLVAMWGEFGRTPKLNTAQGRDHWGACQTAVFAGGGIRGGTVYGSSDRDAAYPKTNPVSPEDLIATVYDALGMSPESEMHDQFGRPHRLVDGRPLGELFG